MKFVSGSKSLIILFRRNCRSLLTGRLAAPIENDDSEKLLLKMYSGFMTEHQLHIFGGIIFLAVIVFGMLGVLVYLDKKGIKTYSPRQKKLTHRERQPERKPRKAKGRKK